MSAKLVNRAEYQRQSFAQDGFRVVDNTFVQPSGEEYVAVYCIEAATGVDLTCNTGDDLNADLKQGMIIYGDISTVVVGTGKVIAYIK